MRVTEIFESIQGETTQLGVAEAITAALRLRMKELEARQI